MDTTEIQKITRKYHEKLYYNTYIKFDKFLEIYRIPKLNQEVIENLNRLISSNEIESSIKNSQ